MISEAQSLGIVDYVIFCLMLVVSASIGIYFRFTGGKQKTSEEYLMAGKDMAILPVAFSLMASFKSAISFIGYPAEIYVYGTYIVWLQIWHIVGSVVAGYFFLPVYFNLQVTTAYEFLERRFGKTMRLLGSLAFLAQMLLYMSVVLYAPALALSAVTTLSLWVSIISIGLVCTLYCTLGGMKAVLWTDVFQAMLMYIGLFAIIIKGCLDLGGIGNVFRIADEGGRLLIPRFDEDLTTRYTFWNLLFQGFLLSLSSYGCSQVQVQRLLTIKDYERSRRALFISIPMSVSYMLLLSLSGIIIYANFQNCDPLTSPQKHIEKADQLLPYFAITSLHSIPGMPGLCICSIFSAALSTVSSAVNSLTAVSMEDFIKPFCRVGKLCHNKSVLFAKLLSVFYGIICILGTFIIARFGGVIQASLTVFGIFGGPIAAVFFLGMFTAVANEKSVVLGFLIALAIVCWSSFGASLSGIKPPALPVSIDGCPTNQSIINASQTMLNFINPTDTPLQNLTSTTETLTKDYSDVFPLYKMSFMWIVVMGFLITVIVGYFTSLATSLITGKNPLVPPECFSPVVRRFLSRAESSQNLEHTNDHKMKENGGGFHVNDPNDIDTCKTKNGVTNLAFDQTTKF